MKITHRRRSYDRRDERDSHNERQMALKREKEGYRIFVTNIPHEITEATLESAFKRFGEILWVDIQVPNSNSKTNTAEISFSEVTDAKDACDETKILKLRGEVLKAFLLGRKKQDDIR